MSLKFVKKERGKHCALQNKRKGKYNIKEGILSLLLAGFLAAVPFTVSAQTASADSKKIAMGIAKNYNLIVFGDFACAGSDTEGAIAVGGNIDLKGDYGVNNKSVSAVGLVIGGTTLSAHNGQVNGKVIARNGLTCKFNGNFTMNDIQYCKNDAEFNNILDFAALKSGLQAESQDLAKLQPNGTVTNNGSSLKLQGKSGAALNVFEISKPADLQSLAKNEMWINVNANSTVVINVAGKDVSAFGNASTFLNGSDAQHQQAQQKILWNFYEAKTLTKSGTMSIAGTVLAPYATFKAEKGVASGNYEGTLIVNEVSDKAGIQGHSYPFSGTLPQSESSSSSTDSSSKEESSSTPSSSEISSVPDESKPVSSTPVSSIPDESVPVSSTPISSVPDESVPVSSTPVVSVPDGSAPTSSTPTASIPDESTPLAGPVTGDFGNIIIFVAFGSLAVITLRVAFKIRKNT